MSSPIIGFVRKAGAKVSLSCFLVIAATSPTAVVSDSIPTVGHVIHISVDGLVPSAIQPDRLRNFAKLRSEGAGTDNARADYTITQTLPSHISQFTGLPVEVHGWDVDGYYGGRLKPSRQNIFDLVSESPRHGKACMYASKDKFALFKNSFEMEIAVIDDSGAELTKMLRDEMISDEPCDYAFLHLREPDAAGHRYDGTRTEYRGAVGLADDYLGVIFDAIEATRGLQGNTAIILTTDHGFATTKHNDVTLIGNYQIPFYVWGPGVEAGADLYDLNPSTRKDPRNGRPDNTESPQPIRHQDAGPMAADFLGIEPTSMRFSRQDVSVASASGTSTTRPSTTRPSTTRGGETDVEHDSEGFLCGISWGHAKANCATAAHCPSGLDTACPSGQGCFANIDCDAAAAGPGAPGASAPAGDNNFCGSNWISAERKCNKARATHCPSGNDNDCPSGQNCFGGTSCSAADGAIRKLNLRG